MDVLHEGRDPVRVGLSDLETRKPGELSVNDAPNCGVVFTIVFDDNS